jgi:hypothetical protein
MRRLISWRVEGSGDQAFGAGELCGGLHGLAKDIRVKGVLDSLLLLESGNRSTEFPCHRFQRRESRLPIYVRSEAVQDTPEDSILSTFMNVRVMPVEIAQAGLEPVRPLLEDEESMHRSFRNRVGKAKLERHIEAWCPKGT